MSPEIVRARLAQLQEVLLDLKPHVSAERSDQERAHYEIERQVQLAVDSCIAIARRILSLRGVPLPETARATVVKLAAEQVLDSETARAVAAAVGLRNLLVHEYGQLDRGRFFDGLPAGFESLSSFSQRVHEYLRALR